MPTVVSFEKRLPPSVASRGTLAELMAKRKIAADAMATAAAPQQINDPMQGFAQLANVAADKFQERRAGTEEDAARNQLAQIKSQIGFGEATPDQLSQIGNIDPELEKQYREEALQARKDAAERQQKLDDIATEHQYQDTRETRIDTREAGQDAAKTAAATATEQAQHDRDLKEGKIRALSPDEAKAQNLDPTRQWAVSADGTQLKDITPDPKVSYSYREPTPEEQQKYHMVPEQPYKMKVGTDGSTEPIAVGAGMPPVAAEVASRVAMAKDFLEKFPDVEASIQAGEMTGPGYLYGVVGGYGRGGEMTRIIESGSEALVRNLTGAGMPLIEAQKYAKRYEPGPFDTADKLLSKVRKLRTDNLNVREGVISGRKWDQIIDPALMQDEPPPATPEAPAAAPAGAPNQPPQQKRKSVVKIERLD